MNKTLYCEHCGNYPDEIFESVFVQVKRKWNGNEYEMVTEDRNEEDTIPFCAVCNQELTEAEEEKSA